MTKIERLLKASLSDEDRQDLLAFLETADKETPPLHLTIVKRGPTNGGKSSQLDIKLERHKT